ncbi:hypothetical protein [Desulfosporosinus sp. SB140]|uniref:hypothetical protein n=1 Tax=Desulfosporosinus paludis TaxID=3115649 RepID=UPI00388F3A35
MLLWGLVLGLIILLWNMNSQWEWNIPPKLERFLQSMKEDLSHGTHRLYYDWKESGENELEKDFGDLQKRFPHLREKYRVPVWVEVRIDQSTVVGPREKYLTCLQRRFPDIEIYTSQQGDGSGD